jgi:hypothetical protein
MAKSSPVSWNVLETFTFTDGPDVDRTVWQSPQWAPNNNPAFFGRTAIRNPTDNGAQGYTPVVGGAAQLYLSTYNPLASGQSFFGSQISTIEQWGLANNPNGVAFEAVVLFPSGIPGGAVTSLFSYNLLSSSPFLHDEIDFEFASNWWSGANEAVNTNVYVDSNNGIDQVVNSTVNLLQTTTFRIEWTPAGINWYINGGSSIRTETQVPQSNMSLTLNFWVPDTSWSWAYNSALQPSGSPGTQWVYQVTSATVYGASG